jgi:hypothetical protein
MAALQSRHASIRRSPSATAAATVASLSAVTPAWPVSPSWCPQSSQVLLSSQSVALAQCLVAHGEEQGGDLEVVCDKYDQATAECRLMALFGRSTACQRRPLLSNQRIRLCCLRATAPDQSRRDPGRVASSLSTSPARYCPTTQKSPTPFAGGGSRQHRYRENPAKPKQRGNQIRTPVERVCPPAILAASAPQQQFSPIGACPMHREAHYQPCSVTTG